MIPHVRVKIVCDGRTQRSSLVVGDTIEILNNNETLATVTLQDIVIPPWPFAEMAATAGEEIQPYQRSLVSRAMSGLRSVLITPRRP